MASDPPPSGPGQPWPGVPSDTPATGHPTGGVPPQGQWAAPQGTNQWAQPQGQWGQAPQGQQPQGQWPPPPPRPQQPPGQWPAAGQQPQAQWPAPPVQQPQAQWGQQPPGQRPPTPAGQPQGQWPPPAGQPQGQWPGAGQQPQGQWGSQQPQGQWPPPAQQPWGQQGQWPPPPAAPGPNEWSSAQQSGWGDPDATEGSGYPVDVRYTPEARIGRYWGIPVLGFLVRLLLLIPHFIALFFVGIIAYLATWLTWIPVLFTGHYPGWGYALVGGYLRWATRVGTWLYLLSGSYPTFSGGPADGQHVRVLFDEQRPINRLWGIPLIGIAIRAIILIPHFIVLYLLGIVVAFLVLFAWIPVLIKGRQADLVYNIVGGWVRWAMRVYAYLLLLAGPYPPFRLD